MKLTAKLTTALVLAALGVSPVAADPGRGNGNGKGALAHRQQNEHGPKVIHRVQTRYVSNCPPGLAKKNPPCVPPGQVGKRYGIRVGDTLRIGDYRIIRDFDRYDLERRQGWDYYRDEDRIYRVDSGTRKILAVLNLIDAFSR